MEYFGFFSALLYLYLEIKQKSTMWIVGIISAAVYAVVFAQSQLFASMALQFYYFGISFYGLYQWNKNRATVLKQETLNGEGGDKPTIFCAKISANIILGSTIVSILLFALIAFVLKRYSDDPAPYVDSFITTLSIVATYWLSKSYIYHWFLWVVTNFAATVLYLSQDLYPTALLYLIYTLSAIYGYIHWKKRSVTFYK